VSYNNIVLLNFELKRYDEAIEVAHECVKIDSTYPIIYVFMGRIYKEQGMYDEALKALEKAVSLAPNNYWGRYQLGDTYSYKGMYEEAIREFTQADRIQPGYSYPITGLAHSYAHTGETEKALRMINSVLDLSPTGDNLYDIARTYSYLKQKEKAVEYLALAIENGWDNYYLTNIDKDLDYIRDDPRFSDLLEKIIKSQEDQK